MDVGIASGAAPADEAALHALYPPRRYLRILDHLDDACRFFIAHSPLLIMGSAHPDQGIDLSPRGGAPGFVRVPDERTVVIPDRAGNNRLDTMTNLLGNDQVGLFFMIPGVTETLRIKGRARLSGDRRLIAGSDEDDGRRLAIVVTVGCAFIHCARALHFSRIWASDYRIAAKDWSRARASSGA